MPRIKFKIGKQSEFIFSVKKNTGLNWIQLSKKISVHPRTLLDWRKEKYTFSKSILSNFITLTGKELYIPEHEVLPDYWHIFRAAQKGGLALAKKYGGPGTPEGRKKGGKISQIRRRLNPELYPTCIIRKKIRIPENSNELAEFIGITAGDGGINNPFQIVITLNKQYETPYADFIRDLVESLFGILPAIYRYNAHGRENVIGISISSVGVVDFLKQQGFIHGNKVTYQIDLPLWIKNNIEFSKNCLRGLIDTDGGIYYHNHKIKSSQNSYLNIGLVFSNKSIPLLNFVKNTLSILGFTPKVNSNKDNIILYRENEVFRYAKEIGFHNPHHIKRLQQFVSKNIWRDA